MSDVLHASEGGSSQPAPNVVRTDVIQRNSRTPHEEDPWKKACVLTLDGGGIRGYASLWILKYLMDAIEKIEKEHPKGCHTSSFWPIIPEPEIAYGSSHQSDPQGAESAHFLLSSRTGSSMDPSRSRHFKRKTDEAVADPKLPEQRERDNSGELVRGYLPCHYFDYIAGTSTGGLNAIMLGRLRMRVEDCLTQYPDLAQSVFGKKRSKLTRLRNMSGTKYDSASLKSAIINIVQNRVPPNKNPRQHEFAFDTYHSPYDLCKTVVVANKEGNVDGAPHLFRTYPHFGTADKVKNPGPADTHEIWQVARATSAAPTYFDPITIDGIDYSDGGVGSNNPVMLIIDEVTAKSGTDRLVEALDVLVSIGAGQKPTRRLKVKHKYPRVSNLKIVKELSILSKLKDVATDVAKAHLWTSKWMADVGFKQYYRWTGGEEVGGLGIDEWLERAKGDKPATAKFIEDEVRKYMNQPDVRKQVEIAAQNLVDRRRARIAEMPHHGRYVRYSHCTLLHCPYCGADDTEDTWHETRENLKQHIVSDHPNVTVNLDRLVQELPERRPRYQWGPL